MMENNSWGKSVSDKFVAQTFQGYCGIEVLEQTPGYCLAKIKVNECLENTSGRLHAGIFYSCLDSVSFLAAIMIVNEGQYPVTHNMNTSLLAAAESGDDVFFEASVIRHGKSLIFIESKAYIKKADKEKKLLAQATIVKSIINKKII